MGNEGVSYGCGGEQGAGFLQEVRAVFKRLQTPPTFGCLAHVGMAALAIAMLVVLVS
jgi:hypothetical protein